LCLVSLFVLIKEQLHILKTKPQPEKKLNAHQQIPDPEISKIQEEESSTGVAAT